MKYILNHIQILPNFIQNNKKQILYISKIFLLMLFIILQFVNLNSGWADNGDFLRVASWFSSEPRPIDNEVWPENGTDQWNRRFFSYFNPYWNYDMVNTSRMFSSVVILWYPGVLINRILFSPTNLYLPILSLGSRFGILIFLLLVFRWIDKRSAYPILHYFLIILPLILILSASDIVAFFNSFYQESASIVFVPLLAVLIIMGRWVKKDWKYFFLYLLILFLVVTSKTSNFFWPLLAIVFIFPISALRKCSLIKTILFCMVFIIIPTSASLLLTRVPSVNNRPYIIMFNGTLQLSEKPEKQLEMLKMPEMLSCIGVDAYSVKGNECYDMNDEKMTYIAALKTLLFEPNIIIKQISLISNEIQNYSLNLGKYEYSYELNLYNNRLNLWPYLKSRFFPRGLLLLVLTPVFLLFSFLFKKNTGLIGDLSTLNILFLSSFWISSMVEILGDGLRDLLKHLVMPNMYFDFMLIAFLNLVILVTIKWINKHHKRKQEKILSQSSSS